MRRASQELARMALSTVDALWIKPDATRIGVKKMNTARNVMILDVIQLMQNLVRALNATASKRKIVEIQWIFTVTPRIASYSMFPIYTKKVAVIAPKQVRIRLEIIGSPCLYTKCIFFARQEKLG